MDILFIDPPWVKDDENLWKYVGSCMPSLGISYIASFLEKNNKEIGIIDCTAEKIIVKNIEKKILLYPKPKFIGITATTSLINNALEIASICKKIYPDTKIILGGAHPTILPDEIIKNENVDFVVRGEGEFTILEILENKKYILGLSYKKEGKIIHNPPRPFIDNLDEMPPPAYHLLPMNKYYPAIGNYKRLPAMSIIATRGCPGRCTFCHRLTGEKLRTRSADNIIAEIKLLIKDYGVKEISFYDDTFTIFRKTVKETCEKIINEKIDITWSCFTRADFVDEELLSLMKKAGCHLILIGVESGDENILKNIKKYISLDKIREAFKIAKKVGIRTRASFMFGNPEETEETMKKTIEFALELDPDEAHFNITTPYPGTEMYDWAKKNDYLMTENWNCYSSYSNKVMNLPTLDSKTLDKYYKLAYRKFYLRPIFVFRWIKNIKSPEQAKQAIKGFFAVINAIK